MYIVIIYIVFSAGYYAHEHIYYLKKLHCIPHKIIFFISNCFHEDDSRNNIYKPEHDYLILSTGLQLF